MDLDSVLVHKHAKKELGQYPAILTSHLINNPYNYVSRRDQQYIFYPGHVVCHHYNGCRSKLRFTQYRGELVIDPMQCRLTKYIFVS